MTNAHEDAERPESEHEDAQSSDAAEARDTESSETESPAVESSESESSETVRDDERGMEPIAVAPIPEAPAPAATKKAPQVARVVASVALLAAVAAGIGVASSWGTPSQPLSIAPPTAYSSDASASATDTTTTGDASTPPESTTTSPESPEPEPTLDITTASSITVLVNKRIPLEPADYAPDDLVYMNEIEVSSINQHALRHDAAFAVRDLFAAAAEAGHVLDMTSGYRDYDLQTDLYSGYVEEQGKESADSTSARPGYSEHQTGLAADFSAPDSDPFCILDECFGETAAGQWLAENAWQYGFILRYPEGETAVTGYAYEPWHFRFIGVDAAADFHESGLATYEEFVGSDAAPDYE